jgi:uncharacterized protein YacL
LTKEHAYQDGLSKYMYECLYLYDSPLSKKLTSTRGSNYYTISDIHISKDLTEEEKLEHKNKHKNCLISVWAFTHVFLYIIIGFYCPNLFIQCFILGAFFELVEKKLGDCHDALDVIFNSIGFVIGYHINKYIFKQKIKNPIEKSIYAFIIILIITFLIMFYKVKNYQTMCDKKKGKQ